MILIYTVEVYKSMGLSRAIRKIWFCLWHNTLDACVVRNVQFLKDTGVLQNRQHVLHSFVFLEPSLGLMYDRCFEMD